MLRSLERIEDSLERFDRIFLLLWPLAVLTALGLGYTLAGQALTPVDRLTRAAYDLANRRAWREALPEPRNKDELWRLSRATNTLLAALAEVIEAERRFTADAAHELRTPLTVLRGRLELALEQVREASGRQSLEKALMATEDLLKLIEKLLLLARTEAGQSFSSEPLALDEVAFVVAELLRPLGDAKGLSLGLELPETPVWVKGDWTALELLTRNLLNNALKFTPSGGVRLWVRAEGAQAYLSVEDDGPGIPAEALPHLFERFYQADVRHRRQGSGLGLALAKAIAHWHGGRVWAENRLKGGACFTLALPLAAEPAGAALEDRPKRFAEPPAERLQNRHISSLR